MTAPNEERVALSGWCNGHPQSKPKHQQCRSAVCACTCHEAAEAA